MRKIVYWLSLILIFMIPWEGVVEFGLGTAAKLMGLVVGACWLIMVAATGRLRRPGPFVVATSLFVLWNAISVLWSADPRTSLSHVWTWVQSLGLVMILWDLFRTRAAILAALQAYVLGAYVAIGLAVVNYLSGNAFYSWYERFSPGEATNPDGFGFIVALGIPVACYLASSSGTSHFRRVLRLANYAYVPAAFLGLALSGTRTAAIAALIGLAFGLASLTRLSLAARIAVLALVTVALYFLVPVVAPLRSFERLGTTATELTQGDLNGRLEQWRQGFLAFSQNPIVGVGANMYRTVNDLGKLAHNSFISVLVELGLIGFVLFAAILVIVVNAALAQPRWDRRFWLTLLLVWAIGSSTLTWEHRKTTWLFLPLVVASATIAWRPEPRPQDPQAGQVPREAVAGRR
jgi:O-antigen ligase